MSTIARHVNLPRAKAYEGLKKAVEKHLGQPLPEGTEVTGISSSYDGYIVNIQSPEFGELPPGASHELKPQGKKQ
jgi:hypothetical protein